MLFVSAANAIVTSLVQELPHRVAMAKAELERNSRRLHALQALQPKWLKMCDLQKEV